MPRDAWLQHYHGNLSSEGSPHCCFPLCSQEKKQECKNTWFWELKYAHEWMNNLPLIRIIMLVPILMMSRIIKILILTKVSSVPVWLCAVSWVHEAVLTTLDFFTGLSFAILSSVHPVFGLYGSLFPAIIYAIFGMGRHVATGKNYCLCLVICSHIANKRDLKWL